MTFTAVIPARYASSRFPGKPLIDISGRPMVVRVAEQARKSGADRVIVATDDDRIRVAVESRGFEAMMTRPDHPTGTDRIAEVARRLKLRAGDIIVNVQGDEPLIAPALIRSVARNLATHRAAAIATAATPITKTAEFVNPNVVKTVLDNEGYALYFSRAPLPWARDVYAGGIRRLPPQRPLRHLGLYAYRCAFLKAYARLKPAAIEQLEALEQLRAMAYGYRISVEITRTAPHPGVDTPADWQRIRRLLKRR